MAASVPLASHEMRWFFEGPAEHHVAMKRWFESQAVAGKPSDVGPPAWAGSREDVYLLVPGADDMGIKWREAQLQVKGRIARTGAQIFCGRHQGVVERWVKWSYKRMPSAYESLFEAGDGSGLATVAVGKTRALRKFRLDAMTGEPTEVAAGSFVDRGLGFELTDLVVAGNPYCSLAMEAFPDDSATDAAFTDCVAALLDNLNDVTLDLEHSRSYPEWLRRFADG